MKWVFNDVNKTQDGYGTHLRGSKKLLGLFGNIPFPEVAANDVTPAMISGVLL